MKPSVRAAYLFIFLFFISFNGLLVYLIVERIAEAKTKFANTVTAAMVSVLNEYNKLKSIDSASAPAYGWIAYSSSTIRIERLDTQAVRFIAPQAMLVTDTVEPAFIETIVNMPRFRSIDLPSFDSLFQKNLISREVHTEYRLDTIAVVGRRLDRQLILQKLAGKKRKEFAWASGPMRMPYNSTVSIFAQANYDAVFIRKDLLLPLMAFAFILLIGNIALVFVYRTIRKQKRINELKTDFINNITHEMKTPITIATAGLEALEHHLQPSERTGFYLSTTKKQLHLLDSFVERILDAALQDISELNLKKEKIDLHTLFTELIQSHQISREKPVNLQLSGEGPVFIHGDRLHLETAFHNIIDNAIKYSKEFVDINIDIVENRNDSIIRIRDNGMGIPRQFVKDIFEKFFRVPQGDAQQVKGFGLGLYYVSNIVKKHSGRIAVHSKWQSGTEFIITLPKHP